MDAKRVNILSTYVLFIHYPETDRVKVGAGGWVEVVAGSYLYVGSAKHHWQKRVGRHLSRHKKMRWHIDYLLAVAGASIIEVWLTEKNEECATAEHLSQLANTKILARGIGSSDCRCFSHFFQLGEGFCLAKKCLEALGYAEICLHSGPL